jgi:hypothetical protein
MWLLALLNMTAAMEAASMHFCCQGSQGCCREGLLIMLLLIDTFCYHAAAADAAATPPDHP